MSIARREKPPVEFRTLRGFDRRNGSRLVRSPCDALRRRHHIRGTGGPRVVGQYRVQSPLHAGRVDDFTCKVAYAEPTLRGQRGRPRPIGSPVA